MKIVNMKSIRNILAGAVLLALSPAHAANIQVVAEIGQPAVGFPSNFVYWNVVKPAIGSSGHIAFHGAADISTVSTNQNTEAVWAGLPGHLHTVIKEGESAAGLPANVLFGSANVSSTPNVVVTTAGSVAFRAKLAGAVIFNATDGAILAEIDGIVYSVLRTGDPAPGFAPGVTVRSLDGFAFTDAGMAISGRTSSQLPAFWFWDGQDFSLIAASLESAGPLYPGCNFLSLSNSAPALNQSGEVTFTASMMAEVDGAVCPASGVFRWKAGQLTKVVETGDQVPGMSIGTTFSSILPVFQPRINEAGDVSFVTTIRDLSFTSATSAWVSRANGDLQLVAIQGESLPGDTNTFLPGSFTFHAPLDARGKTAFWGMYPLGFGIFMGEPIANPYSDLNTVGASHLTLLAAHNDLPPGFDNTWFYDSFSPPLINNRGDAVFYSIVKDALNPNTSQANTLWVGNDAGSLRLVAADGMTVEDNGAPRTVSAISSICPAANGALGGLTTNTGWPIQYSDSGKVIFMAALSGNPLGASFPSSVLLTQTCAQETSDHDFDGDCRADVLLRHSATGRFTLWTMNGINHTSAGAGKVKPVWQVQEIADFGGDGKADLLLRNSATGFLKLWEMDGASHIASNIGPLKLRFEVLGVGDFGGDGKADVLLHNSTTGQLILWEMHGANHTSAAVGKLKTDWQVQGIADFGGDGRVDLLLRNSVTGRLILWEMDGASHVNSNVGPLKLNIEVAGIGDFGGDGKADVLLHNSTTGRLTLWEMNGASHTSAAVGKLKPGWQVQEVADFGGDGRADLLLRNSATGRLVLWEMDGAGHIAGKVGPLKLVWEVQ